MIKDVFNSKEDKILHANLFNVTVFLPVILYASETLTTTKKEEQTSYNSGLWKDPCWKCCDHI